MVGEVDSAIVCKTALCVRQNKRMVACWKTEEQEGLTGTKTTTMLLSYIVK